MKLTTVLSAVNENPEYYRFIPKQILFWNKFNIKFIAVFVGSSIPDILKQYADNIILYSKNLNVHTAFVAQNIRLYYPALLTLPDDEMVMITDMDMLPMKADYYVKDIEAYCTDDFIYYRNVDGNQIYMCYNASHPKTWSKVFGINTEDDIERNIYATYTHTYSGVPGQHGWFTDQEIFYNKLINYPNLKVLNRPIRRLEMNMYTDHIRMGHTLFIQQYDDAHFHRSYFKNVGFILDAESQLDKLYF